MSNNDLGGQTPETQPAQPAQTAEPGRTSLRQRWGKLPPLAQFMIPLGGVLVVATVVVLAATLSTTSRFSTALTECELEGYRLLLLEDEGRTLFLDMEGEDPQSGLLSITEVGCVLDELDIPASTIRLMDTTRALDGRQTDSWDGIKATWSYHPDNGLDVLLVMDGR